MRPAEHRPAFAFALMLCALVVLCIGLALMWSTAGALIVGGVLLFLLACMVYNDSVEGPPDR